MPANEKFNNFSDDELMYIVKNDSTTVGEVIEHNYEYDNEEDEYMHIDWDCYMCEIEDELSFRKYLKLSKKPGALPYSKKSIFQNINISELQTGDYAKYLDKPGVSDYTNTYAECVSIRFDENIEKYIVEWRKSNSDEKSFYTVYDVKDELRINRNL